jgi:hypothetical protein
MADSQPGEYNTSVGLANTHTVEVEPGMGTGRDTSSAVAGTADRVLGIPVVCSSPAVGRPDMHLRDAVARG